MIKKHLKFFLGILIILPIINLLFIKNNINKKNFLLTKAYFNKIDGVNVGTDVRMSGIKIGEVFEIKINSNKPLVYFGLNKNTMIPNDSSISIQTDGLFGNKFFTVEPGGSEEYLRNNDEIIFTEDSILIEDLLRKIIEIGETKEKEILWK